jgi:NADH dehydrogenase
MNDRVVTVFGGTGFLGRHVVRRLRANGFAVRIVSRHPDRADTRDPKIQSIRADIRNPLSIEAALVNAWGVVNAVSLYVEHGIDTFHAIHVKAAHTIAQTAREAGAERLIQISGIGADTASPSLYVRKRAEGEHAVQSAFPGAVILRPAVMFGDDGGFVATVLDLMRKLPAYPMFGRGRTRLQPVAVDDVAEAITRILMRPEREPALFEFGGPDVFTYEELLRSVARDAGLRPFLIPLPFGAWHVLARIAENLPRPPVTRNQVELMEVDTVASPHMPGLHELGITPQAIRDTVRDLARAGC